MHREAGTAPWIDDPLWSLFDLVNTSRVHPLGFPVEIRTNSDEVMRVSAASFGKFSPRFFKPPVRLSLGVSPDSASKLPTPPTFRSRGHLLSIISDTDNFIVCDQRRGFAFGWVTNAVVENHQFFRYYFLEAAIFNMIGQLYLAYVHGALIERNGCGILLCGQSGAGKSTLAYACARAGWTFICDDACGLMRDREDRYGIGNSYSARFREDAASHFPELASKIPGTRANGKVGVEVSTPDLPGISIGAGSLIRHIIFLNRSETSPPTLRRYPKRDALENFAKCVSTGDEEVRIEQMNCYKRLLGAAFWEIRYSSLNDGIQLLEGLAAEDLKSASFRSASLNVTNGNDCSSEPLVTGNFLPGLHYT